MADWLAPLEAAALSLVLGPLLFRAVVLRPAIRRALGPEEWLTALAAGSAWTRPIVVFASTAALVIAATRCPFTGAVSGALLAGATLAIVLIWTAIPLRRIASLEHAWVDTAEAPASSDLARAEALDLALALLGALSASLALVDLLGR